MKEFLIYMAGFMTPITLFFFYALMVVSKDGRDD